MLKQQKGVTLVALVITIIVLLILAGVSIAMLTGDNGILTKATESKTQTIQAEAKEKVSMAINVIMANQVDSTYTGNLDTVTASNIATVITDEGGTAVATTEASEANKVLTVTVTINKTDVAVNVDTANKNKVSLASEE